jgi:hypothetical protein
MTFNVTTYIFVLLLFLLNRLFVVKVWVLYYFHTTATILLSFDSFNAHHIFFYIINCHAKHETENLQMDIHVLATGN